MAYLLAVIKEVFGLMICPVYRKTCFIRRPTTHCPSPVSSWTRGRSMLKWRRLGLTTLTTLKRTALVQVCVHLDIGLLPHRRTTGTTSESLRPSTIPMKTGATEACSSSSIINKSVHLPPGVALNMWLDFSKTFIMRFYIGLNVYHHSFHSCDYDASSDGD